MARDTFATARSPRSTLNLGGDHDPHENEGMKRIAVLLCIALLALAAIVVAIVAGVAK